MYTIQLVLHVTYTSWIQHVLFSIYLKVTSFRISFAAGYIYFNKILLDKMLYFHNKLCKFWANVFYLQSALVISNSKGLSEIHRDTRTSTYQISRIEKNI